MLHDKEENPQKAKKILPLLFKIVIENLFSAIK